MNSVVHYDRCPVCGSTSIHPLLTVKDYSVSGETFAIWVCETCSLRFTQDVPDEAHIGGYYKSENYISHTNTAKGFINQLYLKARTLTLRLKENTIKKQTGLRSGNLLDIGAGTGAFLHYMQQRGWQVTGIEPDADARAVARNSFKLELQVNEALKKLQSHSFDAITLWHVLEHVHQLNDFMDLLKSLLKPTGKLFIAVPNYQSYDARTYRDTWAAYDVPRHLYHFSPQAMQVLLQRHGLKIIKQKPMWLDAFYISLLSSRYKNGKTNWLGALSSGLRSYLKAFMYKGQGSSLIYVVSI